MAKTPNPLLAAIASSVRFAGRRASSPLRKEPEIETLIVDVDRTLTSEDSPKFALEGMCGREKAKEIFDGFIRDAIKGKSRLDRIHLNVFGELYAQGFRSSDWPSLMEDMERKGGIRRELIDAILRLARANNISPVLATRSSEKSALWLAERYGFPFAIGSRERPSNGGGAFEGFTTMIGAADSIDGQMIVLTKVTAAAMRRGGKILRPERTAVLSNDLLDALEMLACAKGILFIPRERNTLEKITYGFRLFDTTIREDSDLEKGLRGALGINGA